jgi:hypothetical protein
VEEVEGLSHPSLKDCALEATDVFAATAAGMTRVFAAVADGCMRYQTVVTVRGSLSVTTAYCNRCEFAEALDVLRPVSERDVVLEEQLEMSVGTALILLGSHGALLPGCERICATSSSAEPKETLAILRQILPPHSSAMHHVADVRLRSDDLGIGASRVEAAVVYPRMRPSSSTPELQTSGSLERLCEAVGRSRPTDSSPGPRQVPQELEALGERYIFQSVGILDFPAPVDIDESSYQRKKCEP